MHNSYKKWLNDGQPKLICICGCGNEIIIKKHYKYYGISKYISGHNSKGKCLSKEHKQKISNANKGKCLSKEHKQKISKSKKGHESPMKGVSRFDIMGDNNPAKRLEVREKISKAHKGKIVSEETRKKLSEINKGKYHSEESKQKMSEVKKGEKHSNWKGGITNHPYCEKWNEKLREEIRNQYDRKCYLCGKNEEDQMKEQKEQGKRPFRLSVHHVDNDKEQGCNGKKWKLIPLCIHCHGKKI